MTLHAPCVVCGRVVARRTAERCQKCYVWRWRHGGQMDRPASVDERGRPRPCRSCGVLASNHGRGLCAACYRWAMLHGGQWDVPADRHRPKPRRHASTRRHGPAPCDVCSQMAPRRRLGRCDRCYSYLWRNGVERASVDGRALRVPTPIGPPRPVVHPCERCGGELGPNPPSYQTLCIACADAWLAAELTG